MAGKHSLIQATVARLAPVIPPQRMWILTNEYLRRTIIRQLPEVPQNQVLAEPVQRNTAPAIGLAAHILRSLDPDAVMGVFPSDHVVGKPAAYRAVLRAALKAAAAGNLMVVGIQPRWPETGYGYIEFPRGTKPSAAQALPVLRFHEKPELANAKRYVAAGNFYWNSGMFFWRAGVLLDQLRRHLPKTASRAGFPAPLRIAPLRSRPEAGLSAVRQHLDRLRRDREGGASGHPVSGIAAGDFGWNDVGSWNAVYELLPRRRLRQRGAARVGLPGCAQQFRRCPRQNGGAAGGATI